MTVNDKYHRYVDGSKGASEQMFEDMKNSSNEDRLKAYYAKWRLIKHNLQLIEKTRVEQVADEFQDIYNLLVYNDIKNKPKKD